VEGLEKEANYTLEVSSDVPEEKEAGFGEVEFASRSLFRTATRDKLVGGEDEALAGGDYQGEHLLFIELRANITAASSPSSTPAWLTAAMRKTANRRGLRTVP